MRNPIQPNGFVGEPRELSQERASGKSRAFFFLLASLVLGTALYRRHLPEPATVRFLLLPPEGTTFTAAGATVPAANFALSPDGRHVAFVAAASEEPPLLWIRSLDSVAPRSLPGTEGAAYPFWSPDGRSIGFFTQDKLKRIEISGGAPEVLCEATLGRGGSWSRLGVIVFAPGAGEPLFRVSASGGLPTAVTTLERSRGEGSHRFPQFLPDGSRFLFYVRGTPDVRGVYLGSLDGKLRRRLLVSEWAAAYARSEPGANEPGHLFFVKDGTLMAQSFE